MSSTADRSPAELSSLAPTYNPYAEIEDRLLDSLGEPACRSCGRPGEVYSVASPAGETTNVCLCPSCAVALADEIAHGLSDDYLDVLVAAVKRRAARRAEREAVAS